MEDAYVIGIRLALDNAVSTGIATIRQDLTALDRAIAGTTANLRQLQSLSAATPIAASQGPPAPQTTPTPSIQDTASLPGPGDSQLRASRVTFERAGEMRRSTTSVQPNAQSAPIAQTASPTPPWVRKSEPSAPSVTAPIPRISVPPATPVASPQPRLELPLSHLRQPTAPPARNTPKIPVERGPQASAASPAVYLAAAPPAPSLPAPVKVAHPQAHSPRAAAPALPRPAAAVDHRRRVEAPAPKVYPAAPTRSRDPASLAVPTAPQSTQSALPSAAPQSPQAHTTPTGGDVFLDGTRMGHWISTYLAREAGRPPAGTTGFDPRLGIAWPGTQQGG